MASASCRTDNYWWTSTSADNDIAVCPASDRADVVIVGGGFTGLWTAYQLLRQEPGLAVVVLEAQEIGFGASGRNAGFVMTRMGVGPQQVTRELGAEAAQRLTRAAEDAVTDLADTARSAAIDCDLRLDGQVEFATNAPQARRLERDCAALQELGARGLRLLSTAAIAEKIRLPGAVLALESEIGGVLHPGKLIRGLASVCSRMGAQIMERSRVRGWRAEGAGVRVMTNQHDLTADKLIIATNAWAGSESSVRRRILPIYSYIAVTEPIPQNLWREIGWSREVGLEERRAHLRFYRRVGEERLLLCGAGHYQPFGGRIAARFDSNGAILSALQRALGETFPALAKIPISHHWGGPMAMTTDYLPRFGALSPGRVLYGLGYNGHGLAASFLGGQILADLALEKSTERVELPIVDRPLRRYPPEPLRWLGGYFLRREMTWFDWAQARGLNSSDEPMLLKFSNRVFSR